MPNDPQQPNTVNNHFDPQFRVSGNDLFTKIIWALMTATCIYAATQLRTLSTNVGELNVKMATMVLSVNNSDYTQKDHEVRIRNIDSRLYNLEGRVFLLDRKLK